MLSRFCIAFVWIIHSPLMERVGILEGIDFRSDPCSSHAALFLFSCSSVSDVKSSLCLLWWDFMELIMQIINRWIDYWPRQISRRWPFLLLFQLPRDCLNIPGSEIDWNQLLLEMYPEEWLMQKHHWASFRWTASCIKSGHEKAMESPQASCGGQWYFHQPWPMWKGPYLHIEIRI